MNCLGIRFRRDAKNDAETLLRRAQQGDQQARNQLIEDYTPFVLKVASQKAGRYLRPGIDEEISVALMAFNEAITAYNGEKGRFLAFSQTVIQRRLVDYFRRDHSRHKEVLLSEFDEESEDGPETNPLDSVAHGVWNREEQSEVRRQEILEYQAILQRYRLSFSELARCAPKHRDSRERAIKLARAVADNPKWAEGLISRQELPVKELTQAFGVSRKLIERNRKYIIAVTLILMNDLPYLQDYV